MSNSEATNYITDEVRALIGKWSQPVVACDVVERGALRRFTQAIMDPDPLYWDDDYAAQTRFGGVVAPPFLPLHAFRQEPGSPDPLDAAKNNPDYDGAGMGMAQRLGLPEVPIPLKRLLNGGNDLEVYALAKPGDRIHAVSRYKDIYQKEGRSGTMVFVIIETEYYNQSGQLLLVGRQTLIWR